MGERVHAIRARLDDVEDRWRRIQRPQRHRTLPAPARAAVATAITIVEVRAGLRPPHQLERLSHYSLWPIWPRLPGLGETGPIPIVPHPLAVTVRELAPGLVDATVVIDFGGRPHALALRLDGAPGFWQLLELDYPTERMAPDLPPLHEPFPALPRRGNDAPFPDDRERPRHWQASPDTSRRLRGDLHLEHDLGESLGIELE